MNIQTAFNNLVGVFARTTKGEGGKVFNAEQWEALQMMEEAIQTRTEALREAIWTAEPTEGETIREAIARAALALMSPEEAEGEKVIQEAQAEIDAIKRKMEADCTCLQCQRSRDEREEARLRKYTGARP